jgi:hypothetical protein
LGKATAKRALSLTLQLRSAAAAVAADTTIVQSGPPLCLIQGNIFIGGRSVDPLLRRDPNGKSRSRKQLIICFGVIQSGKVDEGKQLILCSGVAKIQKRVKVDEVKQLILCFGVIKKVKVDEGNS